MILDEHLKVFVNTNESPQTSKEYSDIVDWVAGCEGATWDYNCGNSRYFGDDRIYYTTILFDNEEDLLFCRLKFPTSTRIPK